MSKAVAVTNNTPVINITSLIGEVNEQGRKFTDARNALIAHALAIGVKQSIIVTESKVDKGDVSRINKAIDALAPTALKSLKSMVVSGMVAADAETLSAAITFGAKYLRRAKPPVSGAAAGKGASTQTAQEDADPTVALYDWLLASTPEQFEARTALVVDILARVESDRAAAAAETELEAA